LRYFLVFGGGNGPLKRFIISDCMLLLGRRQSAWLSCTGGCSRCKNILLEEALADKFFHVPPETSEVSDLVSLAFVEGTILSRSGKYGVMLDRLRASYPRLVFDGIKGVIDGEPQLGKMLLSSEGSEWIWGENRERLLLEGVLPQF